MKISFILPVFLLVQSLSAQSLPQPAKGLGMGNATVALQDANSLFVNQAGLAFLENFTALASAERRFMLSELNQVSAGAALPVGLGAFGLTLSSFGFDAFRQQKLGLAYARRLFENFSFGAQFDYFQTRIPDHGSKGVLTFEAGMQGNLPGGVVLGIHVFNPVQVQFVENEPLPSVFRAGVAWTASEKATFAAELEKDIDFPIRVKAGVDYLAGKSVFLRLGFGTNPATFHFGLGYQLPSKIRVDAASGYHQVLGFSPAAAVSYSK